LLLALEALIVVKVVLAIWVIRELRTAPGAEPGADAGQGGPDGANRAMPAQTGPSDRGRATHDV